MKPGTIAADDMRVTISVAGDAVRMTVTAEVCDQTINLHANLSADAVLRLARLLIDQQDELLQQRARSK